MTCFPESLDIKIHHSSPPRFHKNLPSPLMFDANDYSQSHGTLLFFHDCVSSRLRCCVTMQLNLCMFYSYEPFASVVSWERKLLKNFPVSESDYDSELVTSLSASYLTLLKSKVVVVFFVFELTISKKILSALTKPPHNSQDNNAMQSRSSSYVRLSWLHNAKFFEDFFKTLKNVRTRSRNK